MNEENMEMETPENQEEVEVSTDEEGVEPQSTEEGQELDLKQFESALRQKEHFREKYEKEQSERKALEDKLNELIKSDNSEDSKSGLDIEDYIDISASLEGLDQKEKAYLAREHKLSGKPLSEIRKDEDFKLWQSAYRRKVVKEQKTLTPSGTQSESAAPKSLAQRLASAKNLDEKEKILTEAGLYKQRKYRSDKTKIDDLS